MKTCRRCGEEQPESNFYRRARAADGLATWCKPCHAAYDKQRYQGSVAERERKRVATNARRARNRRWIWNYLLEHPCVDCGEDDPIVLEFDHLDPATKEGNISNLMSWTSVRRLKREVAQCVVRCSNCHKRRTALQFGWYAALTGDDGA